MDVPEWYYDEFHQAGVDYQRKEVAGRYDTRHGNFRDFAAEAARMIERTGLATTDRLIDFGCGTGAYTLELARHCRSVDAVDPSAPMLDVLAEKIERAKIANVTLHHAGVLTYRHSGEPADAALSSIALHHLPDPWKVLALKKIADALRPGGSLYIFDVFFTFEVEQMERGLSEIVEAMSRSAGREAIEHVKREFSTFDWIFEAMLEKTGFAIRARYDDLSFLRAYVCVKKN